jgi:hypothetical protein
VGAGATEPGHVPGSLCCHVLRVVRDRFAQRQGRSPGHLGVYKQYRSANGDLRANFVNGVASTVTILNTPLNFEDDLKADFGSSARTPGR